MQAAHQRTHQQRTAEGGNPRRKRKTRWRRVAAVFALASGGGGGFARRTLRMRRLRRVLLRFTGLLLLLAAVLGGLAVAGWLPPFDRWVERRLLAELIALGVQADAAHLRELSWRRAVVGPVELQLPGLALRAEEARAELGWRVLTGRISPRVVVTGLALDIDLDRTAELRGALQPSDGGFPYGRLDMERARLVLRRGGERLELPLSGFFNSQVEEFRAVLVLDAPALSGRLGVRGDLGEGTVEVKFHEVQLRPEHWRALAAGLLPAAAETVRCEQGAAATLNGTATLAEGRWRDAVIEATLPAIEWRDGAKAARLEASELQFNLEPGLKWRGEIRTPQASWIEEGRKAELSGLVVQAAPDTATLRFAELRAEGAGFRLVGAGEVTGRRSGTEGIIAAETKLQLASAEGPGWNLAAPAQVWARWNGAELTAGSEAVALGGAWPLQLEGLELVAGGLRENDPRVRLVANAAVPAERLLAAAGPGWRLEPAIVAAKVTANATLATGNEGVRAEITLPAQRRMLAYPGGQAEAVVGGERVVNLDRTLVSGRAALEVRELAAAAGSVAAAVPDLALTVRWPRVWLQALTRTGSRPDARFWRDLWWMGDYELSVGGAAGRMGADWRASGVDLRLSSRGAELHETGGLDLGLKIAELALPGGVRTKDTTLEVVAGLGGGTVRAASSIPGLPLRPTLEQKLSWADDLTAEGTFGFDPAVFAGNEPLGALFPALAGCEVRGGLGVSGRNRYAAGRWTLAADVILNDLGLRWPKANRTIEGVRGRLVLDELRPLATKGLQTLTVQRVDIAGAVLTDGKLTFGLAAPGTLTVQGWSGAVFGGTIEGGGFTCDVRNPAIETQVKLQAVRLDGLLALFDDVPAEAHGTVDGALPVRWRDGKPGLGTGFVRLSPGEMGRVRFTKDLHLLTSGRTPGTASYEALRKVELAIQVLVFNRLQIDTYPKDADGQSIRVRLVGAPAGNEFNVPVNLDVNVNAPLEHFFNLGRGPRAAAP